MLWPFQIFQPHAYPLAGYFCLEDLAPELRIQTLLTLIDFSSLRSLVRASPAYHASYLIGGREKVLSHIALQQLDHCLRPDALAAVRSKRFDDPRPQYIQYGCEQLEAERLNDFLDEYGRARIDNGQSKPELISCKSMTMAVELIYLL
jgi:hypothetical protein